MMFHATWSRISTTANETMAATATGRKYACVAVISTTRNMAIKGARRTAAITAAMPETTNTCTGSSTPKNTRAHP